MKKVAILALLVANITACGGGSDSDTNKEVSVSVNAGSDQVIDEKSIINLTAIAAPAEGVFTWTQKSGPIIAGFPLEGATQSITAPEVKQNSQLTFQVQYKSPDNTTAIDEVVVIVNSINQLPTVIIEQTAPTQLPSKYADVITLSSVKSVDPDTNGSLVNYQWEQTKGTEVNLPITNQADLSFSHPLLDENTQTQFSLTITDDENGSQTNYFDLLLFKTDKVIEVDTGVTQTANEFETVLLDASKSQTLTPSFSCVWSQTSGTSVNLIQADECISHFSVPDIDATEQLLFTVIVKDEKNRTASGVTRVNIKTFALGIGNDSGMTDCFDELQKIDCNGNDFPGQDADFGRDSVAQHLDKAGFGESGFDFTKLDEFADELPNDTNAFSCVRDNVTGLIWEVKQANTGTIPNAQLREGQNHYTWFYSGSANGGVEGTKGAAQSTCTSSLDCGLETYVNEVNATNYCGGNNWRVPSYNELMSIMDLSKQGQAHLLNTEVFPNIPVQTQLNHLRYWTLETSADGQSLSFAWVLDMQTGNDIAYPKSNTAYLRLVRTP
ncbi:DUF1566 domain-containing protein [Pseudoalteromonas denitrificans]|uniref:Lcl C-terminal domain-containing protein n=1 Tax=Pseudoalteromonas denitrificans DSM 6059 TaxID=1123010 RepID=A0A1I1L5M8_9GAMM|nr:DUF1566 domain-containing protein [Pseudoalteromonas denitrificans]SFC68329.1 Protein of unknown function [Pseudoalteromonas denitrificans DSM 6059]